MLAAAVGRPQLSAQPSGRAGTWFPDPALAHVEPVVSRPPPGGAGRCRMGKDGRAVTSFALPMTAMPGGAGGCAPSGRAPAAPGRERRAGGPRCRPLRDPSPRPPSTPASRTRPRPRPTRAARRDAAWTPPTWEQVVQEHSARVYRLAYRLTGNRHDAEDLTQEVFVRVFRSLSTYTPGTFEGWLHRITTNLFLDQVRRKQRIRFDALADDAADRLRRPRARPGAGLRRQPPRRRRPGGARRPAAGVPRRRRALRHRGPLLRGDRRHARRQAGHRPLPDPPRPGRPAPGPGAPRPDARRRLADRDGDRSSPGGEAGL